MRHLALEPFQEFLKEPLGFRVDEIVFHQLLNLPAQAGGQVVQLFPVAVGPLLQQVVETFRQRRVRFRGLRRRLPGFDQAAVNALPLRPDNFLQPFLEVVHHRVHVVLLQLLAAAVFQLLHQVAQAGQLLPFPVLHPVPQQFPQRLPQVAILEQLVGQLIHQLVGVQVKNLLGAVPAGVAVGAVQKHSGLPLALGNCGGAG